MEKRTTQTTSKPGVKPLGFIISFGLVSCLMDIVYQGALSVQGPLLASVGATAAVVGIVSGLGEATALAGRLFSGPAADKTGRYWVFAILGYAATALAVPAMGFAGSVVGVSALIIFERFGKSLRTPSRDAMLSHAASAVGKGKGFALHELMDQIGAVGGPLIVAAVLSLTHSNYAPALCVLAVPGVAAIVVLLVLRNKVPDPRIYEPAEAGMPGAVAAKSTAEKSANAAATEASGVAASAAAITEANAEVSAAKPVERRDGLPKLFWIYTCFCGLALAGVGTFGVMSYHMVASGAMDAAVVPLLYAGAMAVDAVFALITGSLYDRVGTKALYALPVVSALIPVFTYTQNFAAIILGVVLWGASLGIQESTMRAAVADMVPPDKRATSYGLFSVAVGIGAMVGGAVAGVLYDITPAAIVAWAIAIELAALVLLTVALNKQKRS